MKISFFKWPRESLVSGSKLGCAASWSACIGAWASFSDASGEDKLAIEQFNPISRIRSNCQGRKYSVNWAGGGGKYSYICVLPDELLLKPVVIRVDFKRTFVGQNANI